MKNGCYQKEWKIQALLRKKGMCLVLVICGLLLSGCTPNSHASAQRQNPEFGTSAPTEPPVETTEASNPPGEEAAAEASLVADAFFDDSCVGMENPVFGMDKPMYFHIPRINLDHPSIGAINQEIFHALYYDVMGTCVFRNRTSPTISQMAYACGAKGDILSILVTVYDRYTAQYWDSHQYMVYNVSVTEGAYVPDDSLIAAYGLTGEEYESRLREAVREKSRQLYERSASADESYDDYWQQTLSESLSEENLAEAKPYIDASTGDLCVAVRIYITDGDGSEEYALNLTGSAEPTDPASYGDIRVRRGDSQNFWEPPTAAEFEKACTGLEVSPPSVTDFYLYPAEYWPEEAVWRRYLELKVDGGGIVGAYLRADSCELMGTVSMYYPEDPDHFGEKTGSGDLRVLHGSWVRKEASPEDMPVQVIFREDGTARWILSDKTEETLPYRQFEREPCVIIGERKYLFSFWEAELYLFPEGESENPAVYGLEE